jgi:DNA-binding transcriptional LysR family regulator
VVPTVTALAVTHPHVALTIREYEPAEAHAMLAADEIDLALTYDYDLAPAALDPDLTAVPLWSADWGLAVPSAEVPPAVDALDALGVVAAFAHRDWIGNSRNRADEQVLRTLASMAGVAPRLTHEADSLELVEDLILAGLGVGLLPRDRRPRPGVEVLALTTPGVRLRAYAVTRRGRAGWPALALVLARIEHRADRR